MRGQRYRGERSWKTEVQSLQPRRDGYGNEGIEVAAALTGAELKRTR